MLQFFSILLFFAAIIYDTDTSILILDTASFGLDLNLTFIFRSYIVSPSTLHIVDPWRA